MALASPGPSLCSCHCPWLSLTVLVSSCNGFYICENATLEHHLQAYAGRGGKKIPRMPCGHPFGTVVRYTVMDQRTLGSSLKKGFFNLTKLDILSCIVWEIDTFHPQSFLWEPFIPVDVNNRWPVTRRSVLLAQARRSEYRFDVDITVDVQILVISMKNSLDC